MTKFDVIAAKAVGEETLTDEEIEWLLVCAVRLKNLVESKVLAEAPSLGYSEAYLLARNHLDAPA